MASPFHGSLDTPLLDFGGEVWTIRDAVEAVAIVGAPGSGKSSASAKSIRKACLKAGMGALFLAAKIDEAANLIAEIKALGRGDDLVVIDASANERFNILDYAHTALGGQGFEANLVEMMRRMSEATRVASGKPASESGENSYFVDGAMKWLSHVFPLLLLTEGTIRLADVNRFITSIANTPAELQTDAWHAGYCGQVHGKLRSLVMRPNADPYAVRTVNEHGLFFLTEVPALDNRPRSSIASTLTNLIYPFLSGRLADIFCTDTTITPQACRDGKIIIMDLPVVKYGPTGAVAQTIFKYLFGMVAQNEIVTEQTRPVMLYMDEVQNFLSSSDADLLATGRGSKICPIFITQDYPTFYAKLGEQEADSLLAKFGTRIFHANSSHKTNLAASDLIYKVQKFHVGETQGTSDNSGRGGSQQDNSSGFQGNIGKARNTGQSSSGYVDYEIPPDHFATKLRTGTKRRSLQGGWHPDPHRPQLEAHRPALAASRIRPAGLMFALRYAFYLFRLWIYWLLGIFRFFAKPGSRVLVPLLLIVAAWFARPQLHQAIAEQARRIDAGYQPESGLLDAASVVVVLLAISLLCDRLEDAVGDAGRRSRWRCGRSGRCGGCGRPRRKSPPPWSRSSCRPCRSGKHEPRDSAVAQPADLGEMDGRDCCPAPGSGGA